MTIEQCATAVADFINPHFGIDMLAIAGAESGYDGAARGDSLESFPPAQRGLYSRYAVDGFLSFGPWQIFLPAWADDLTQLSGSSDPAQWASYLSSIPWSAQFANLVLRKQGLKAWSAYNNEAYIDHQVEATVALSRVVATRAAVVSSPIVAVSFSGRTVHLDRANGSFDELLMKSAQLLGPWLRFELGEEGSQQPLPDSTG